MSRQKNKRALGTWEDSAHYLPYRPLFMMTEHLWPLGHSQLLPVPCQAFCPPLDSAGPFLSPCSKGQGALQL